MTTLLEDEDDVVVPPPRRRPRPQQISETQIYPLDSGLMTGDWIETTHHKPLGAAFAQGRPRGVIAIYGFKPMVKVNFLTSVLNELETSGRIEPVETVRPDPWERPLADIAKLEDGWGGRGSKAPTALARDTMMKIVADLQPIPVASEFMVDDEDGSISLTWSIRDRLAFLTLVFLPDGRVTILARDDDGRKVMARIVGPNDRNAILGVLRLKPVAHLLVGA
jgi:hypothetical protein